MALLVASVFLLSLTPTRRARADEKAAGEPTDRPSLTKGEAPNRDAPKDLDRVTKTRDESAPTSGDVKRLATGADKSGVSGTAIAVPQGSGKIQGMGESFSAQLSSGIATYSIPLALPNARGSVDPTLALSYSSGSGHGAAGVGWEIGVPFIARQTDRGIPSYVDPPTGTAWVPNQDRFVFNGGQELVPICLVSGNTCGSAIPGEVFPTSLSGYVYFRPRIEGSFLRFFWAPDHKRWLVQDKSGGTLTFGGDDNALETDTSGAKVFRWNLAKQFDSQRDASGNPVNVVHYRYLKDRGLSYLSDIWDTPPASNAAAALPASYAHHTRLAWEPRPDRTSSYRRGYLTEQGLRLSHVDVTSKNLAGSGAREMVRKTLLSYDKDFHTSILTNVQVEGRCATTVSEDGSELLPDTSCPRLPAIKLGYQHVAGFDSKGSPTGSRIAGFEPFDARILTLGASPAHSLDDSTTELFDVNADGLPDVVNTSSGTYGGKHGVFFNELTGFRADTMPVLGVLGADSTTITFANPNVATGDLDGDGIADLLHMPKVKTYSVYTPIKSGKGYAWKGREITTASALAPKIDFGKDSADSRTMDVNGDGLVDVVVSTGTELLTYFSLAKMPGGDGQFGTGSWTSSATANLFVEPAANCIPWAGLPVRLSDPDVRVGDLNGDHLVDIVRVAKGKITYWPGRGNGFFGTGEATGCKSGFASGRELTMPGAPEIVDLSGIRLDDVNGDGLDDLVQIRSTEVDIWLNLDGVSFSERATLFNTPEAPAYTSRARLVDINGSGTRDILYGDGLNYRYMDLAGGKRPWVLTTVDNGLGKTTTLDYSTTAELAKKAADAGEPWTSFSPSPMHVVVKETVDLHLDKLGLVAPPVVTEYVYRDPVYDGQQREFRGFASVKTIARGDTSSPTSITRSTFLLGECKNEFAEIPDPCSYAGRFRDNPREALKGLPLTTETFDETGVTLSTGHSSYRLRTLYTGLDGRRVRYAYGAQSDTWVYDTASFAPALTTISPSDAPDVWVDGTPTTLSESPGKTLDTPSSITLRAATFKHLRSESTVDSAGNPLQKIARGCIDCTPVDEVITQTTVSARPAGETSGWMFRATEGWVEGNIHTGLRKRTSTTYDAKGNATSNLALLSGTLALDRFHENSAKAVAPTPPGIAADGWISTGSTTYDIFGNAIANTQPEGRCRGVVYDSAYAELPITETVYAGSVGSGGCGSVALTSSATYDRGLVAMTEVVDLHGEKSKAVYDGFGRIVFLHKPHPTLIGQITTLPAVAIEYHLAEDVGKPVSWVKTLSHDATDLTTASYREVYAYADGAGRALLSLEQADTNAGDLTPWVATGAVRYNAKGQASTTYRPWFFTGTPSSPTFGYGPAWVNWVSYDAFGRPRETHEQGEDNAEDLSLPASKVVYRGLTTETQDRGQQKNGIRSIEIKDGHGRVVKAIAEFNSSSALTTENEYLPTGEVVKITRSPSGGTPVVRWLQYDSLGRMVRNVEPHASKNFTASPSGDLTTLKSWRYAYNQLGDLVGTSDARGCGTNYHYDAAGRLLAEDYSPCLNSQQAYSTPNLTTGYGTEVLYRYDLADADGPTTSEFPLDPTLLLGRLVSVSDRGAKLVTRYDGRGRITGVAKKIATPTPSDSLSTRYASSWTTQAVSLDAADRPLSETTGAKVLLGVDDLSTISTAYSKRGSVKYVTSSYGGLIGGVVHDATGLPKRVIYADLAGTTTEYTYDERLRPFVVETSRLKPGGAPTDFHTVLNFSWFAYDASNNPKRIWDQRIASEWPTTAKPVDRQFTYDNWSRITSVTYTHAGGSAWKSNFDFENGGGTGRPRNGTPAPHRSFSSRIANEAWTYDLLGNTTSSSDDQNAFYDRSLGTITNGGSTGKPYQLQAASGSSGGLTAAYDDAGYLASIAVTRSGTCLPAGATCSHRYAYEWDEVGRLSRARRWDLSAPGTATDALPTSSAAVELTYEYDSGDNRTRKTSIVGSAQKHTVYILSSLELRGAAFASGDYVQNSETEVPYLFAHGVRLARVAYEPADVPSAGALGRTHIFLFVADHLGSVSSVIDRDTSELVEHGTTTPYGQIESDYRPERWKGFREDYRFTGKEEDIEVGLTYFGFRYYAPALGRWISADPLAVHGLGADANVYAYVHGKVMSAVDPQGLEEKTPTAWDHTRNAINSSGLRYPAKPVVDLIDAAKGLAAPETRLGTAIGLVAGALPGVSSVVAVYSGLTSTWNALKGAKDAISKVTKGDWVGAAASGVEAFSSMVNAAETGVLLYSSFKTPVKVPVPGGGGKINSSAKPIVESLRTSEGTTPSVPKSTMAKELTSEAASAAKEVPQLTAGVREFQSDALLAKHFGKHAADWGEGNITLQGYAKRAESLLRSEVGGDIQGFTSMNGFTFRYNTSTNEFATMKPNGVIETLFRPKDGMAYWLDQIAKYHP